MPQSRFSNSILLIGISLIFANTLSMIVSITYEVCTLLLSLFWSFFKVIPNALTSYPLTVFCLGIVFLFNKKLVTLVKSQSVTHIFFSYLLACGFQCQVCSQHSVDTIIQECGHTFHKSCAQLYIQNHKSCPLCKTITSKQANKSLRRYLNQIKMFIKKRTKMTLAILLCLVLMAVFYNRWWTALEMI